MRSIPPFHQRQPITAAHLNQLVEAVNALTNLRGDGLVNVDHSAGGVGIGLNVAGLLPLIPKLVTGKAFVVKVYQNGGDAGDHTATCTWTYECRDLDGTTVLDSTDTTPLSPQKARIPMCAYTKAPDATYGLAVWVDGALVLLEAYGEYPTTVVKKATKEVEWDSTNHEHEYDHYDLRVLSAGAEVSNVVVTVTTECDDT